MSWLFGAYLKAGHSSISKKNPPIGVENLLKIILFSEISLDGKLTVGKRSSKELLENLSEEETNLIQKFRKNYDAILVGSETVRIDNPNLTYRAAKNDSPIRIILSNKLNFSFKESIFTDDYPTVVVTDSKDEEKLKQIASLNKEVLRVSAADLKDMNKLSAILENKLGIKSLLVEGGGLTNWSFLKGNLFDEVHLLQFPILIGGRDTPTLVDGEGFSEVDLCINYHLKQIEQYKTSLYLSFTRK